MSLQMSLFHSFLGGGLSSIPLYVCTTSSLSIHLSMDMFCCHVLAILNSDAMNIGVLYLFEL